MIDQIAQHILDPKIRAEVERFVAAVEQCDANYATLAQRLGMHPNPYEGLDDTWQPQYESTVDLLESAMTIAEYDFGEPLAVLWEVAVGNRTSESAAEEFDLNGEFLLDHTGDWITT